MRDFVPSALAFLMNGEPEIVKNFLLKTLRLQSIEKRIDCFTLGEGVMPASFKVSPLSSRCCVVMRVGNVVLDWRKAAWERPLQLVSS